MGSTDRVRVKSGILAYTAALLFLALFISEALQTPYWVSPVFGLFSHLIVFPIIALWPAPNWARAAGYGWLIIDVTTNVAAWNLATMGLTSSNLQLTTILFESIRQGIHVNASIWIAAASWNAHGAIRLTGLLVAFFLTITALAGPWLPVWFVYPGFVLLVVWLTLLGRRLNSSPTVVVSY